MATTINASTSAGLVSTADTSGVLQLQTANTTGLTVDASQNVTLPTGNLIIGTSGKGIDFSATPGTGTSELLNDYEEGTWTPVLSDGTNNATSNGTTFGNYVKVGRMVTCTCYIGTTSLGSVSGNLQLKGLPFASAVVYASPTSGWAGGLILTAGNSLGGFINSGNSYINLYKWSATTGTTTLTNANWSATGEAMYTFTYFASTTP